MFIILALVIVGLSTDAAAQTWRSHGPGSASVTALAIDVWRPSTLFAGTSAAGVFRTSDAGQHWVTAGLTGVEIRSLAFDSVTQTLYAGTADYGLLRSMDLGTTWRAANSGLFAEYVNALAVDLRTSVVYAAADRVYRSSDAGEHWTPIDDGISGLVESLAIDLWRPGIMYAGTRSRGVFRTDNGGQQWYPLLEGVEPNDRSSLPWVYAVAIDVWSPDTVYFADPWGPTYRSANGGWNWEVASRAPTYVSDLVVDPAIHTTLYAASRRDGVLKSIDSARTWFAVNAGLTSRNVTSLVVDPASPATLYVGTSDRGVFKSTDGGASWNAINHGLSNAQVAALAVDPWSSTVYAAGLSGIHRGSDSGQHWSALNAGVINTPEGEPFLRRTSTIRAMAVDLWVPSSLYAVTSDRGIIRSGDGGQNWHVSSPAPPVHDIALDLYHHGTLYAATHDGVMKSRDGGTTWNVVGLDNGWVDRIAIDPTDPSIVYAAHHTSSFCVIAGRPVSCTRISLAKSTDAGMTWSAGPAAGDIEAIVVDPQRPATLYTAIGFGGVARSGDGGASWTIINDGLGGDVRAIVIDPAAPSTLYAGSSWGVFKSIDGGDHWTMINEGLTDAAITSLAIDPSQPGIVYAGTANSGVFVLREP